MVSGPLYRALCVLDRRHHTRESANSAHEFQKLSLRLRGLFSGPLDLQRDKSTVHDPNEVRAPGTQAVRHSVCAEGSQPDIIAPKNYARELSTCYADRTLDRGLCRHCGSVAKRGDYCSKLCEDDATLWHQAIDRDDRRDERSRASTGKVLGSLSPRNEGDP